MIPALLLKCFQPRRQAHDGGEAEHGQRQLRRGRRVKAIGHDAEVHRAGRDDPTSWKLTGLKEGSLKS